MGGSGSWGKAAFGMTAPSIQRTDLVYISKEKYIPRVEDLDEPSLY